MFLLRRAASRAISAAPSKSLLAQPRSITTFTPSALRIKQQQWSLARFQQRFASDDAAKNEAASENFAQTAAEAPIEDGLTPAQEQPQEPQAESTDAAATVGIDALEQAAKSASRGSRRPRFDQNPEPKKTLYVGNLFYEVKEDQLQKVFSRFGEIEEVKLIYDGRGLSRGFGYITFKEIADAQSAIDNLNQQVFEGRNLVVQYNMSTATPRNNPRTDTPNTPAKTLFIGNMSFEMSDKDLNDLFRDIRNVLDVRVAIDRRTGQPRGFAHADFVDVESATKARDLLQNKTIYGRRLRIDYSASKPRNDSARGRSATESAAESTPESN